MPLEYPKCINCYEDLCDYDGDHVRCTECEDRHMCGDNEECD